MSQIIKKALALCASGKADDCRKCPYYAEGEEIVDCWVKLTNDALVYIETLEQRLREKEENHG